MTVGELIVKLGHMPIDAEVIVVRLDGGITVALKEPQLLNPTEVLSVRETQVLRAERLVTL